MREAGLDHEQLARRERAHLPARREAETALEHLNRQCTSGEMLVQSCARAERDHDHTQAAQFRKGDSALAARPAALAPETGGLFRKAKLEDRSRERPVATRIRSSPRDASQTVNQ